MSKSITGSGSLNLTLQELRLLEIKATSVQSTNATITNQLSGKNAEFTGILSVGSLTITGSFSVVNLTSTGTITGNDITITGTMTYKGQDIDVRFVSLTQLNTALASYVLTSALNSTLSNYVLTSALNSTLSNYVLTSALNTELADYVDLTSSQTISGVKSFTSNTNVEQITLDTGSIFNHSGNVYMGLMGQYTTDIAYNIAFWSDGHVRFVAVGSSGFRFYSRDPVAETTTQIFRVAPGMASLSTNFTIDGALTIDNDKEITYKAQTLDSRFAQISTLSNYVLTSALTTTLSDYVLTTALNTELSNYVDKSSAQTIAGVKTFNDNIIIGNPTTNLIQVNRIKMNLPLIFGSSGNEFPLLLWNKDNANNEKQLGHNEFVFFDAFNGILKAPSVTSTYTITAPTITATTELTTPSLKISTATTRSVNTYYSVLIRDTSDGQVITDTELRFNTKENILKSRSLTVENRIRFSDEDDLNIATDNIEYQLMSRNPNTQMRYSTNASINGDYDGNDNARITIHAIDAQTITTPILLTDTIEDATDINFKINGNSKMVIDNTNTTFTNSVVMNKSTSNVIILKNLPINYKETMQVVADITSSEDDNGTNVGLFGSTLSGTPVFLKILNNNSAVTWLQHYPTGNASNLRIWNWETSIDSLSRSVITTDHGKYFYMHDTSCDGSAWTVSFKCRFQNKDTGSARVAPALKFRRTRAGGAVKTYHESLWTAYCRMERAQFTTIECKCLITDVLSTDTFQIITSAAEGVNTLYTSVVAVNDWAISNIAMMFQYEGYLNSRATLNPADPANHSLG